MGKPLITVFCATGALGGGVTRELLCRTGRPFRVRAATRDPGGVAVEPLAACGAEIIAADLDDPASVQRAVRGACGVFVAVPRAPAGAGDRADPTPVRIRGLIDAAQREGVRHLVCAAAAAEPTATRPTGGLSVTWVIAGDPPPSAAEIGARVSAFFCGVDAAIAPAVATATAPPRPSAPAPPA